MVWKYLFRRIIEDLEQTFWNICCFLFFLFYLYFRPCFSSFQEDITVEREVADEIKKVQSFRLSQKLRLTIVYHIIVSFSYTSDNVNSYFKRNVWNEFLYFRSAAISYDAGKSEIKVSIKLKYNSWKKKHSCNYYERFFMLFCLQLYYHICVISKRFWQCLSTILLDTTKLIWKHHQWNVSYILWFQIWVIELMSGIHQFIKNHLK